MIGWLSRIGGCLVAPRRTLARLLGGERGGVGDMALFLLVVMIGSAPDQLLRLLGDGKSGLVGGILLLVSLWVAYSLGPLLISAGLGLVLAFAQRFVGKREVAPDALISTSTYLWVPVGLLSLLGAQARALGWDAWMLPHAPWSSFLEGHPGAWQIALKALGSYGWSAALAAELARTASAPPRPVPSSGPSSLPALPRYPGWLTLGVLLLAYGVGFSAAIAHYDEIRALRAGDRATRFTLPRADGQGKVTLADFSGKPLIVEFWATWCPSCVEFLPALHAWASAHPQAIVLSVHQGGTAEEVRAFLEERLGKTPESASRFIALVDESERVSVAYRVDSVPVFFAVAPDGLIRSVHWGVPSLDWLDRLAR